jgi:hypothetical protein
MLSKLFECVEWLPRRLNVVFGHYSQYAEGIPVKYHWFCSYVKEYASSSIVTCGQRHGRCMVPRSQKQSCSLLQ